MNLYPHSSPDSSIHAGEHANVNKTIVEVSERTVSLVAIVLATAALIVSGWAIQESYRDNLAAAQREAALMARFETAERESRMAEYYILELDGKLMAGGFIPPSRGYGQWKKEHSK